MKLSSLVVASGAGAGAGAVEVEFVEWKCDKIVLKTLSRGARGPSAGSVGTWLQPGNNFICSLPIHLGTQFS